MRKAIISSVYSLTNFIHISYADPLNHFYTITMNPFIVFPQASQSTSEKTESKKISYWLQKLFDQQEQKKIDNQKEKVIADEKSVIRLQRSMTENKSPPQPGYY